MIFLSICGTKAISNFLRNLDKCTRVNNLKFQFGPSYTTWLNFKKSDKIQITPCTVRDNYLTLFLWSLGLVRLLKKLKESVCTSKFDGENIVSMFSIRNVG